MPDDQLPRAKARDLHGRTFRHAHVYDQVAAFINAGDGTTKLTRVQKGQFVAVCWREQVRAHVAEPKPSHVPAWNDMPEWWQQTDSDIFEHIEQQIER